MANEVVIKDFDTIYSEAYADLAAFGSEIANTTPGGHYDLLIRAFCRAVADAYQTLEAAMAQGFTQTATGSWLDLKAVEYGTARKTATKTVKEFKLTRTSTAGTLQVAVGDIIKTPVIPELGQLSYYSIISTDPTEAAAGLAGEFTAGVGEIYVRFEASNTGSDFNNIEERLDETTTTMEIESGLTGVDEVESTGEDLEPGINEETDTELRERLLQRWAELAAGATRAAYISFAKNSHPSVWDANVSGDQPGSHPTDVEMVISGPPGNRVLNVGTKVDSTDNFDSQHTDDGLVTGNEAIGTTIHEYIRARAPLTDYVYLKDVTGQDMDITVAIKPEDGTDYDELAALLETRLEGLFIIQREVADVTPLEVGETLLFSTLTRICNSTPGLADFRFTDPDPGTNDGNTDVDADTVLTLGTITITELT